MKRRTFIRMVGASALGLPFMYSQFNRTAKVGAPAAAGLPAASTSRRPYHLALSPEERGVVEVLRRRSKTVCLVGGGVAAKAVGSELPYVNLVTESDAFGVLKNDLFAFGVQPISTPELPSHFIRFVFGETPFSVLNLELEKYLTQNALGHHAGLLPLAHNFLVYSADSEWVIDPYGALSPTPPRAASPPRPAAHAPRIKRLQDPTHPIAGLELCLAVAFDAALLGLEPPADHAAFEQRVLAATVNDEREATVVFHQALSFFPDLLELKGWQTARQYLVSPLCLSAAAKGPGIDLKRVAASLERLSKRGIEVSSVRLVGAINKEIQTLEKRPGVGLGLPDYLAVKKLPVRRTDLLAEVMRSEPNLLG